MTANSSSNTPNEKESKTVKKTNIFTRFFACVARIAAMIVAYREHQEEIVTKGEQPSNQVVAFQKALASGKVSMNLAVRMSSPFSTSVTGEGRVHVHGGLIHATSTSGSFFKAWPIGFQGVRGMGFSRLPGDPETTYFADADTKTNLRMIEVSSGGLKNASKLLYDDLSKAIKAEIARAKAEAEQKSRPGCVLEPQVRRMQVVITVDAVVPRRGGAIDTFIFNQPKSERHGLKAKKYVLILRGDMKYRFVFEGDAEFMDYEADDNFAIEADEWIRPEDLAAAKAAVKTFKSAKDAKDAYAKGEISSEELLKHLGFGGGNVTLKEEIEAKIEARRAEKNAKRSKAKSKDKADAVVEVVETNDAAEPEANVPVGDKADNAVDNCNVTPNFESDDDGDNTPDVRTAV